MNRRKILISISIIIGIIALALIGFAAGISSSSQRNYAVIVKDDGTSDARKVKDQNENIEVQTKVIEETGASDEVKNTEVLLETSIKNLKESKDKKDFAIVIDSSYSMAVNADNYNIKQKAIDIANTIIDNIPDNNKRRISIVCSDGIKQNITNTNNKTTFQNAINGITFNSTNDFSTAIETAKGTLNNNSSDVQKYLILLSDATDNVATNLNNASAQGIKVYSILSDITSTSFGDPTTPVPSDGTVYLMNSFNENDLLDDINKTIKNISVKEALGYRILDNFEVIIETNDGTVVQNSTDNSIEWNFDKIISNETKTMRYRLKLKRNQTIGSNSLYKDINVIDKTTVKFNTVTFETEDATPVIQIADAYDIEIHAIGQGTTIPVEGVVFNVIGRDENDNVVVDQQGLTTDSNGNVTVKTVKPLGKIYYSIIPSVNLVGYEATNSENVLIENKIETSSSDPSLDVSTSLYFETDDTNGRRKVTIDFPITLQKFKIVLDVKSNINAVLPGLQYNLIEPNINNSDQMNVLSETTDSNGSITFDASIKPRNAAFDYFLSEETPISGFGDLGVGKIRIRFNQNGKVQESGTRIIEGGKAGKSSLTIKEITEDVVHLELVKNCESTSVYTIDLNLKDHATQDPIENAFYNIKIDISNPSTGYNNTMVYPVTTDANGNINFDAVVNEQGYTQITVSEISPNPQYIAAIGDEVIVLSCDVNGDGTIVSDNILGNPANHAYIPITDNRTIKIDLESNKKSEINLLRIHVNQLDDQDVALLNVPLIVREVIAPGVYGNPFTIVTNNNGDAEITLPDPSVITDGSHRFEISLAQPVAGYYDPGLGIVNVSIQNGRINSISGESVSGQSYNPITGTYDNQEISDTTFTYLGYATFSLQADENATSYLKIQLTDKDSGAPVEKGKYEITMERNNAAIINSGAQGKYTGSNGYTSKMAIPGLDSTPVTIYIAQKYDATLQNGYKVDPTIYKIVVRKDAGGLSWVASLDDGTDLPSYLSVTPEGQNTIVFNHKNQIINPGDVILNLSIVKFDWVTKQPQQLQNIAIWSDDFDIYDKDVGQFCSFGQSNPYNPFTTGIYPTTTASGTSAPVTIATSSGQIDIRIKPNNLQEVLDPNNDGYPIDNAMFYIAETDGNGQIIPGTRNSMAMNFVYSKDSGTYKFHGVGNVATLSLLKDYPQISASKATAEGWEDSVMLQLWSNYGETANFGIDFSKYNKLDQPLDGAEYSVKVMLPSGSYVDLNNLVINGNDTIEMSNLYVKEGAIISITEKEAPIGYEKDTVSGSFKVQSISPTGVVTFVPEGIPNPRITLDSGYMKTDGSETRYIQKIKLVDLEKNSLKFGIQSKDKDTLDPTQGNSYKLVTNTGSIATTNDTDFNGKTTTLIGGEKENDYMEYTITQDINDGTNVSQYYKRVHPPITVKVYFDANGNIENDPTSPNYYGTLCAAADANYGTTWYIDSVNADNKINIVILQEREEPLNIDFMTKDEFTQNELTGIASYSVTPTVVLNGIENYTKHTQVGFVDPGKTVTYTLHSNINENYVSIPDQRFIVSYDNNGDVINVEPAPDSKYISTEILATKRIKITTTIEPAVPFAIYNSDYYTGAKLQNAEFEIERIDGVKAINKITDSNGNAVLYDGEFGEADAVGNQTYIYNVKQNTAAYTYATVEEFKIYVEYNSNREIVSAGIYGNGTDSTNKFINVHKHATCTAGDVGYNGNNKGIVDIEVKNYPAFNIEFTNVDRIDNSKKLQGAKFEIVSSIDRYPLTDTSDPKEKIRTSTNGTDVNGMEMAYVDRTLFGTTVTYEITNFATAHEYQKTKTIKIEVDFDSNGYVNINGVNPVRIIEGSEYAEIELYNPATTNQENFGIKLKVKSTPEFRINLDNIDRAEYEKQPRNIVNLAGAEYDITSDYNTSAQIVKPTQDTVVVFLQETPINDYVTYTIHEIKPAMGYQTIEKDIIMKVHFDANGCIDDVQFTDSKNNAYAEVNRTTTVLDTVDTYKNFAVDLCIRNNPLIALNLTKESDDGVKLNNVQFNITGKIKNTQDIIFEENLTTLNGLGAFKLDRALDNTTVVYTIKETKNTPGYEYIPSELTLEVPYDNAGKIISNDVKLTPQVNWATVTSTSDYGIELNVIDKRITDIQVNLNTIDAYDNAKKASVARIKAYFTENNVTYNEDVNHSALLVTDQMGHDCKSLGKAENIVTNEIQGIQKATLVLKEDTTGIDSPTPSMYYEDRALQPGEVDDRLQNNIYMSWAEQYGIDSIRIDLTFTDEGKIATQELITDALGTTPLGRLMDKQYVKVEIDPTHPYILNVELKYYPMLELKINSKSDNSYAQTPTYEDNELIGTYEVKSWHYNDRISTQYSEYVNMQAGLVKAGYIGTSSLGGIRPNVKRFESKKLVPQSNGTANIVDNNVGLWAGEQYDVNKEKDRENNGRIRYLYIYEPNTGGNNEKSEPQGEYSIQAYDADTQQTLTYIHRQLKYQQHGTRDWQPQYLSYNNALICAIQVKYNEKGEIISAAKVLNTGASSRSRVSEQDTSDYYGVYISENKHGIEVPIQYKRTTTVEAEVVDNISGANLSEVTLSPFNGDTDITNRSYYYEGTGANANKRNLARGQNSWTYWGGNSANGNRICKIGVKYNNGGSLYNGYEDIQEVDLDVHYDEYGYIDLDNSRVLSTNSNGEPNAEITGGTKEKINIKIIASRKFDVQIDKKDNYDRTIEIKDATFDVIKITDEYDQNLPDNPVNGIREAKRTQVGLLHNNKTVVYEFKENAPSKYYSLDNFKLELVFNNAGKIKQVTYVDKDGNKKVIYDILGIHTYNGIPIKVIDIASTFTGLKPRDTVDLRFELYDEPKFETNLTLRDQFYHDEVIPGVSFSIKNDTYNIEATGELVTNAHGTINTSVGTVYPGETVQYTIKQRSTANGYYMKNSDIVMQVTFDNNGYVSNYVVTTGNDNQSVIGLDTSKRGFNMVIYNKPQDVRIGIEKYDQLTNEKLANVSFDVERTPVGGTTPTTPCYGTTSAEGDITGKIDSFTDEKEIVYTIKETAQLEAYRKIEDIVIRVKYKEDGSIDYYNVDSNPSNAQIIFANNSLEKLTNQDKVHIKVVIPNDDAYDIIVRDEDEDIAGLGIEGTIYNVDINGTSVANEIPLITDAQRTTNASGYMSIRNRRERGNVTIKVSEAQIGRGYREKTSNSVMLSFTKGTSTYSLDLNLTSITSAGYSLISGPTANYDNNYKDGFLYTIGIDSNTEVIVGVYQDTGKITYTFKNKSKQLINLRKIDAETGGVLEGAEFEIIAQEVDNTNHPIGDPVTLTTPTIISNSDGRAYLDIGTRVPNKKIKYTFKEVTPPEGFLPIGDIDITCTYNNNGRIVSKDTESKRIGTDDNWDNLNVTIKNGDIVTYSVKIVSIDSRKGSTSTGVSNNRINGSIFDITIKDQNNSILYDGSDIATGRTPNSFGYEEDGVIVINGLRAEGDIRVHLAQTGIAEGFIQGNNLITGEVSFNNQVVIGATSNNAESILSGLNNGGFIDSYIDENEGQVIIKVYNDPIMKLNLHKVDLKTGEPIEGAKFTITSIVDRNNTYTNRINVTTEGTDANGNELVTIGAPEYGKTVIYTIHEEGLVDYDEIEDTKIKVTYDTFGKINNWEVLGDETFVNVRDFILDLDGIGETWTEYTQEELDSILASEYNNKVYTQGSRKLNTEIKNKSTIKDIPYNIIVEVQDMMHVPIEGLDLNLDLRQGIGGNINFGSRITDVNGQITYQASGSDLLQMYINMIDPKQYTFDDQLFAYAFKNTETGSIQITDHSTFADLDNANTIHLTIIAKEANDEYGIAIFKMDKSTHETIVDNPATFTVTREEKDDLFDFSSSSGDGSTGDSSGDLSGDGSADSTGSSSSDPTGTGSSTTSGSGLSNEVIVINDETTNTNGILTKSKLKVPEPVGTYTYKIYETFTPTGYKVNNDPIEFNVTFGIDESSNKVITSYTVDPQYQSRLKVESTKGKGLILYVYNEEDVPDTEIMLDIFKVDAETKAKLDGAYYKVKLPDGLGTSVFTESGENADMTGQLDYCYIEQDKDYEVRLKHMPRPALQDVKDSPGGVYTQVYTFKEIAAPDGYVTDSTPVDLIIEYEVKTNPDGTEQVVIKDAQSGDLNLLEIYNIAEDQIGANLLNKEDNSVQAYTVTYDGNTISDPVTNVPDPQLKTPGIRLTLSTRVPQRAGYRFKEWNTNPDGSGDSYAADGTAAGTYNDDRDITLYAIWEIVITYNENVPIDPITGVAVGVVTDMPYAPTFTQIKDYDVDIVLDDDGINPSIPGASTNYIFTGWNTMPDGTGAHYDPNDSYTTNACLDLYAEWSYEIKYVANLPTDSMGFPLATAQNMPQDETVPVTKDSVIDDLGTYGSLPTATGYVFKEWNTNPHPNIYNPGTTYSANSPYTDRKSITLYAIWEYEVTYDQNMPTDANGFPISGLTVTNMPNPNPESFATDVDAPISSSVPQMVPDDYEFIEWNTKPDGSGDSYNPSNPASLPNLYTGRTEIKLYAIWQETSLYLNTTNNDYMITDATVDATTRYTRIQYNTTDELQYNDGDKYIVGILPQVKRINQHPTEDREIGTKLSAFKNDLNTNGDIKVYKDSNNNDIFDINADTEIGDNDLVGTGMFLHITRGSKEILLRLIVRGDVTKGDGVCYQPQLQAAIRYITQSNRIEITKDMFIIAMDMDLNGSLRQPDIQAMIVMKELYCKYACYDTITVTLDTNGGILNSDSEIKVYNKAIYNSNITYKCLPIPQKSGFTFIGWKDDNGNIVDGDTIVTNTNNHTLHATYM